MKMLPKSLIGFLALLLASAGAFLTSSSVQAADYPAPTFSATLEDQVVVSGENVVIHAQANTVANWDVAFNGENRVGVGTKFTATFKAPVVTRVTFFNATVHAETVDESLARGQSVGVKLATFDKTLRVKVLPEGSKAGPKNNDQRMADSGVLPNTGGPNFYLLLGGLLLLLAGLGAVIAARRTADSD